MSQPELLKNVVLALHGVGVDWLLTEDAFDLSRFSRKVNESIFGLSVNVSAPEDTILQKLHWAQQSGGSEKHFTDALRVYEVQFAALDQEYLDAWAAHLGVVLALRQIRTRAQTDV